MSFGRKLLAPIAEANVTGLVTDLAAKATTLDPSGLGISWTVDPRCFQTSMSLSSSNVCAYSRLRAGGIAITKVGVHVGNSSGNASAGAYTNTGTGRAAAPGTRLQTSGAVACPANGYAEFTLGGSITPNAGDWLALSTDNNTATFWGAASSVAVSAITAGFEYLQTSGHPVPSPVGTMLNRTGGFIMIGVP